jgi:hypothetical protein
MDIRASVDELGLTDLQKAIVARELEASHNGRAHPLLVAAGLAVMLALAGGAHARYELTWTAFLGLAGVCTFIVGLASLGAVYRHVLMSALELRSRPEMFWLRRARGDVSTQNRRLEGGRDRLARLLSARSTDSHVRFGWGIVLVVGAYLGIGLPYAVRSEPPAVLAGAEDLGFALVLICIPLITGLPTVLDACIWGRCGRQLVGALTGIDARGLMLSLGFRPAWPIGWLPGTEALVAAAPGPLPGLETGRDH